MENNNEKVTTLRSITCNIGMPKSILIGDPLYFETGDGLKYTYNKSFRGKTDWVGNLTLTEDLVVYNEDDTANKFEFNDIYFKAVIACDNKLLDLINTNRYYKRQKIKLTEIGVDSASYILEVNGHGDTIRTGGDGSWGGVSEYYTNNKLEAIVIELGLPAYTSHDFENHKKFLESLFNCNFN